MVTGGGTLGEGVQLWDFRDLEQPVVQYNWGTTENGETLNPVVNCVKFVPNQSLILAGCSDDVISAKCFDQNSGHVIEEFPHARGNCFSLDVASDGSFCTFGDADGIVHFENICYDQ